MLSIDPFKLSLVCIHLEKKYAEEHIKTDN